MNQRQLLRPTLTFLCTALLAFALFVPREASSTNLTIPSINCVGWPGNNTTVIPAQGNSFSCGIPMSTALSTSTIDLAYFDYYMGAGQTNHATLRLDKISFTGATGTTDSVTGGGGGWPGTQFDTELLANHVKLNASPWDYVQAELLGVAWVTGVAISD